MVPIFWATLYVLLLVDMQVTTTKKGSIKLHSIRDSLRDSRVHTLNFNTKKTLFTPATFNCDNKV